MLQDHGSEVTTTDELIPSGETSSYRSNPLGLAEFTLSRRDPEYVGKSKAVDKLEKARTAGQKPSDGLDADPAMGYLHAIQYHFRSGKCK